jgi:hypothetical protein
MELEKLEISKCTEGVLKAGRVKQECPEHQRLMCYLVWIVCQETTRCILLAATSIQLFIDSCSEAFCRVIDAGVM